MPLRRPVLLLSLVVSVLVATAAPALAHASFDVRQVPAGEVVDVQLRVPIEVDSVNSFVDVLIPEGWSVASCEGADGWDCASSRRDDGTQVVNLAAEDDGVGVAELFSMTLVAPTGQGTYSFPVVQTYADGTEAAWIGDPGSDRPVPQIQVGDDATPVERSTELPSHDEDDDLQPSAGASTADGTPDDAGSAAEQTDGDSVTPSPGETADAAASDEGTIASAADAATGDVAALGEDASEDEGTNLLPWLVGALVVLGGVGAAVAARR